jgi:hypothetical protein
MSYINSVVDIYHTPIYELPNQHKLHFFIQFTISQNYEQSQFVKYGFSGSNALLGNKYPIKH